MNNEFIQAAIMILFGIPLFAFAGCLFGCLIQCTIDYFWGEYE